jgi:hypothetical protein
MRISIRQFTNGFPKTLENHLHALSRYVVQQNWARLQETLRMSPAIAAGVTDRQWSWDDIIAIIDAADEPKMRAENE